MPFLILQSFNLYIYLEQLSDKFVKRVEFNEKSSKESVRKVENVKEVSSSESDTEDDEYTQLLNW